MQDLIIQRRQLLRMGSAAAICGAPLSALASEFPSKRIRFVVPFPAAGIVDIVARALSDDLAADLGQPVVVEALPGAAAAIGTLTTRGLPAIAASDQRPVLVLGAGGGTGRECVIIISSHRSGHASPLHALASSLTRLRARSGELSRGM